MNEKQRFRNDKGRSWKDARDIIVKLMMEMDVGELLTYDKMQEETGLSKGNLRHAIWQAQNKVAAKGRVFSCVRNEGYRRENDSGIVKCVTADMRKGRRHAVRSITRGEAVDITEIEPDEAQKHQLRMATMGLFRVMSHGNSINAKAKKAKHLAEPEVMTERDLSEIFKATMKRDD